MTARRRLALLVLAIVYGPTLYDLVYEGWTNTYAGHVLFVPAFAALFAWANRDRLRAVATKGSPAGLAVVVAALVLLALGRWSSSLVLQTLSIVMAVAGLVLWWAGWRLLLAARASVGFLIFMIPLPLAVVDSVTLSLQRFVAWSSAAMLDLLGVPVHHEGVFLTLPQMTLEVAEVCNGLRFLMTLLVLTIAFGQVSQRTIGRKVLLAVVAVPVAILANAVRVAGIAFAAFHVGPEAASGFYHLLVGKVVWGVTIVVLVAFGLLLRRTTTVPLEHPSLRPLGAGDGHPRVVLVAASLDILGGQGVQARTIVERLRGDGYTVDFVPINPRFPRGLHWIRRYPYVRTVLNEALYLPSLLRLARADVAHVFSASYWSFLLAPAPAIVAARALRTRVVLHYHSGEADDHLTRWGALVHPWLRLVDEIVVPSEYLRDVFARHGYRARVIRNVVDTSQFRYRERMPLYPRLLCVRNFEPHYGIDTVLRAFALVRAHYPEATLTLAGSGSEQGRLHELARSLGISPMFVGRAEPETMPALYDRADIFLNASVVDNQPVSVLEAFAAGLPVVSTGTGDIPAMLRQGTLGLTVPQADPGAMAKAVVSLLEEPHRALSMTRDARQEVERYTWPVVREHWARAYAADCGGPG